MHYEGSGVSQDYAVAYKWCKLAAEKGDAARLDIIRESVHEQLAEIDLDDNDPRW